jgi:kynurenine formamidase
MTPEEKKKRLLNQEKYILERIKTTHDKTKKHQNLIITGLPTLDSNANLKRFS